MSITITKMNKEQVLEHLKTILPSVNPPKHISVEMADSCLFIKLGSKSGVANMQTDESSLCQ